MSLEWLPLVLRINKERMARPTGPATLLDAILGIPICIIGGLTLIAFPIGMWLDLHRDHVPGYTPNWLLEVSFAILTGLAAMMGVVLVGEGLCLVAGLLRRIRQ